MKRNSKLLRILVVDDEPLIRLGLIRALKNISDVKTVTTAEEALNEIGMQYYDLCFLDFNLPGMSGLEAMKIIHERSPSTKVAIMSGSFIDDTMKKQIDEHAYAFIEKPFNLSNLFGVAEKVSVTQN